jgi:hypothetical protein
VRALAVAHNDVQRRTCDVKQRDAVVKAAHRAEDGLHDAVPRQRELARRRLKQRADGHTAKAGDHLVAAVQVHDYADEHWQRRQLQVDVCDCREFLAPAQLLAHLGCAAQLCEQRVHIFVVGGGGHFCFFWKNVKKKQKQKQKQNRIALLS